ncbi:hypothetical protein JMM81_08310 [Bacillus sp. V3B]|uniref:hypothetical protein n=1 Tax=Bacillus sp. V3B TaxID=2804915 RepID=UPI002109CDEB|nr:hypothetical protein [Bacillus sp. V3B]MCQ6274964.1 hypothetical protein [Bacillus sp. V3B]
MLLFIRNQLKWLVCDVRRNEDRQFQRQWVTFYSMDEYMGEYHSIVEESTV